MILTENTFRTLKNALAQLDGSPGSSRLGEAMAAGWGFADYHALRAYLHFVDTDFYEVPERYNFDVPKILASLENMGCVGQEAIDLVATFMWLQDGDFFFSMFGDYRQLAEARILRHQHTTPLWRRSIESNWRELSRYHGGESWIVPFPADWRGDLEYEWVSRVMMLQDPLTLEIRDPNEVDFDNMDLAILPNRVIMPSLLEAIIARTRDAFPSDEYLHHLTLDEKGVRICCGERPHEIDMWFATFNSDHGDG